MPLGLTFIELILSMSITAMIGLGIASMLFAVSYGTSNGKNLRSLVVKSKIVSSRFTAALRSTQTILAKGNDYLVVWMDDTDSDGQPKLSELRRIAFDSANNQLLSYKAPSSISPASDTLYDLNTTNFNSVTAALIAANSSNFVSELWATGVNSVTYTLDNAAVQQAVLVSYQLNLQAGDMSELFVGAVALRSILSAAYSNGI